MQWWPRLKRPLEHMPFVTPAGPVSAALVMHRLIRRRLLFSGVDSFANGTSAAYTEGLWEQWSQNSGSVSPSWNEYFNQLARKQSSSQVANSQNEILLRLQLLVRAYQVRGHTRAQLDPLGITSGSGSGATPAPAPELELEHYDFSPEHLRLNFPLHSLLPHATESTTQLVNATELLKLLRRIYCGTTGIEFMHIPDRTECDWLRSHFEKPNRVLFTREKRLKILQRLARADAFERFLHQRYPGEKRFGLEGLETLVPVTHALVDVLGSETMVNQIVLGMAHRGRLNLLANVAGKRLESIFCEFAGDVDWGVEGSGDERYHLGATTVIPTNDGRSMHLSLVANPSHLEAVNPVVLGKTRAHQDLNQHLTSSSVALLVHGDAAFSGQGVVYESLGLSALPSYSVGGTVHLVANNQIGFTTDPRLSRSTPYCTDVARVVDAPVLHVNADSVEDAIWAAELAMRWRDKFRRDVVVDVIGYRRHGHNEFDDPAFTQPLMYERIRKTKRVAERYAEELQRDDILSEDQWKAMLQDEERRLEKAFAASRSYQPTTREWLTSDWKGFPSPAELATKAAQNRETGVAGAVVEKVAKCITEIPPELDDFALHRGVLRLLESRRAAFQPGGSLDMPLAESLAFGSLLAEGFSIRLSGQDVERGTFCQRHAVFHDQHQDRRLCQLKSIAGSQAFVVCNSSLSEFGVLGFEYGYSLAASPQCLVVWEAQFGDFANNAQCIIDQFIASGERKWLQRSGLVMLLPHGYDGAGPEHSNAHIERFLSLCDDSENGFILSDGSSTAKKAHQNCNMQIVMPSTPASYFHVLRRQMHRDFRKPLVVFTSKSLLRNPQAKSTLSEFLEETRFTPVIGDQEASSADRVIFCAGQVYYALAKERERLGLRGRVAIVRLEELAPFPFSEVAAQIEHFGKALDFVYCQEEAQNVGPWSWVSSRLNSVLAKSQKHSGKRVEYVGREANAAIATGFKRQHVAEERAFISQALLGKNGTVFNRKTLGNKS